MLSGSTLWVKLMWFRDKNERPVKCQDCGFLAIRDPDNSESVAPSVHYRMEGFQGSPKHLWPHPQPMPNCFVRAYTIQNEPLTVEGRVVGKMTGDAPGDIRIGDGNGSDGTEAAILSIIQKERMCKEFYPWVEGFSPREHYEFRQSDQRRRSDRKWRVFELGAALFTGALIALAAKLVDRVLSSGNGGMPIP